MTAVDAAQNTIIIGDQAPAEVARKTFPVAADALVVIDGKKASLAGLAAGASVNLNLRVDQKTVGMIQTKGP